jgi:serine/threonine-protein kinase
MGEVYLAEDPRLRRKVALKTVPDANRTEEARKRLRSEARAAARLTHPNVAAVYDVVEADNAVHVVMEYVVGETLARRVREKPLPVEDALDVGIQLAEALAEAHAAGVIHRDLKSNNVMLTPDGRAKVLDFGLARMSATVGEWDASSSGEPFDEGRIVGTPAYMAPELFAGQPADARSDIYSLGVTLFEALTGRRPFQGPHLAAAVVSEPTPRASQFNDAVTPSLDAVVAHAMARNRAERFGSAAELAAALRTERQRVSEGTTAVWQAPGRLLSLPRATIGSLSWRSPRPYAVGAVVLVLAIITHLLFRSGGSPRPVNAASTVVAILPLASGDPGTDHIGVGIADVLVTSLARVPGVTMISRDATLPYRDGGQGAAAIARELGADLLVDGRVQASGSNLRVTLNLQRPASNQVLWSGSHDGDVAGIFTLQNEAAMALSKAVQVSLTPDQRRRLQRPPPTANTEAFAEYLQARSFLDRPDVKGNVERSVTLFESAIAKDPRFARAHAGLGEAHWQLSSTTRDQAWSEKALLAITEALRLDPEDSSARRSLAVVYAGSGRTSQAIEELRRAVTLEPENDEAHRVLGEILLREGRQEEGFGELKLATTLRPNYWRHQQALGLESFRDGRYAEAAAAFRRVTELQPDNPWGFSGLGMVYYATGDAKQAIENFRRSLAIGGDPSSHTNLGVVLYAEGRYAEAAQAFEEAVKLSPLDPAKHRNVGDAYQRMGQSNRAKPAYTRAVELCRDQLRTNPRDGRTLAQLAVYEAKLGSVDAAVRHADEAVALGPHMPDVHYRKAVVLALAGRPEESLRALDQAINRGYSRRLAQEDDDLASLRGHAEFIKMTAATVAAAEKGVAK